MQHAGIRVHSEPSANHGRSLYVMIRSVPKDEADTALESYEDATRMLFAAKRAPDVIAAEPIFPGVPLDIPLAEPVDHSVILYFFFTYPGESWRVQVPAPVPASVEIELGENEVNHVEVTR
jgi:hypothetical protein